MAWWSRWEEGVWPGGAGGRRVIAWRRTEGAKTRRVHFPSPSFANGSTSLLSPLAPLSLLLPSVRFPGDKRVGVCAPAARPTEQAGVMIGLSRRAGQSRRSVNSGSLRLP